VRPKRRAGFSRGNVSVLSQVAGESAGGERVLRKLSRRKREVKGVCGGIAKEADDGGTGN